MKNNVLRRKSIKEIEKARERNEKSDLVLYTFNFLYIFFKYLREQLEAIMIVFCLLYDIMYLKKNNNNFLFLNSVHFQFLKQASTIIHAHSTLLLLVFFFGRYDV